MAVTGEVPTAKRAALIDRFQNDDKLRVFIGQIHAAGIGINLTSARQVVFNDIDWVPANHWQAENRVHRIGQNRSVNVTHMVGKGTMEEFVRSVLEVKSALIDKIVEGQSLAEDGMDAALRGMIHHVGATYDKAKTSLTEPERLADAIRAAPKKYLTLIFQNSMPHTRHSWHRYRHMPSLHWPALSQARSNRCMLLPVQRGTVDTILKFRGQISPVAVRVSTTEECADKFGN